MSLPARQRRVLDRIETSLRRSDPRLVAMFAIFARLTHGEEIPRFEELRHRFVIMFLRARLLLRAMTSRRHRTRGRAGAGARRLRVRRPVALLFPAALLIMTITIVLVARFGSTPRCGSTTAAATARAHPRGRLGPRTRTCAPRTLSPALTGR
jgi:hypothetical protein